MASDAPHDEMTLPSGERGWKRRVEDFFRFRKIANPYANGKRARAPEKLVAREFVRD
jgi:hypothetical protein